MGRVRRESLGTCQEKKSQPYLFFKCERSSRGGGSKAIALLPRLGFFLKAPPLPVSRLPHEVRLCRRKSPQFHQ